MAANPFALMAEIESCKRQLARKEGELRSIQASCAHDWSKPEYTPDVREGYYDPGDPPGTMGIDRRLPFHVPREEKPKWTRTCGRCGKVEVTTRQEEHVTRTPKF